MIERDKDQEAIILQQALKMKAPIPDKILQYEELLPGLEFYLEAYLDLCSDKQFGFGEGPVPWSAIDTYAKRYDIEGDDFDRLVNVIRAADAQILEAKQKKSKRELKTKQNLHKSKTIGAK